MVVRIGSRGSRLALTQAELASAVVTAGRQQGRVRPDHHGRRPRPLLPFGQIGERGVFVKEIEEALLAGRIDVAVHSAKDMTSTDTAGLVGGRLHRARRSARRAGRRRRRSSRECESARRRFVAARSCSLSIRRCRSSRSAGTSTPGCGRRPSVASTRSCLPRAASTGSASPTRSGSGSRSRRCCPRPRRELSRSRCGRARRSSSPPATAPRPAGASRPSGRRGAIGAGCLAPVAAHHDGERLTALVAAEDGSWVERRTGSDPATLAAGLIEVSRERACA